jgi:lysozyme
MLRGSDASSVQRAMPFKALAEAGHRFVIMKAQQGNDGFDPWFERNMRSALAHGIEPFAYCFAYPLEPGKKADGTPIFGRDPKEQAKICVDEVYRFPEMHGRPIFLDLEWPEPGEWAKWGITAKSIAAWCRIFCAEVYRLAGVKPIIYTYPWWWAEVSKSGDVAWASEYPLWLAAYIKGWPAPNQAPRIPKPWTNYLFWQFDGNGGLVLPNGVDADFCVFNGTEEDLHALAHGAELVAEPVVEVSGDIVHDNDEMIEAELTRYRERQARILEASTW